jgi:hypothetical protein
MYEEKKGLMKQKVYVSHGERKMNRRLTRRELPCNRRKGHSMESSCWWHHVNDVGKIKVTKTGRRNEK